MANQIEANSLSDITSIASNPPKYPLNPAEQKRSPLTLYIVRVPGSSDVFLTPMKPQLKDVTAQDVMSSLYYFHLDTEDDARFLKVNENESILEEPPPVLPINTVPPRKPLPPSARSSLEINRHLEPSLARTILEESRIMMEQPSAHNYQMPLKRPLGPRPLTSNSSPTRKPLPELAKHSSRQTIQTHVVDSAYIVSSVGQLEASNPSTIDVGYLSPTSDYLDAFSITVFRRDPTSGGQWNVAKIVGQPLPRNKLPNNEAETKAKISKKRPYFTFSISLATPGYNKFHELTPIPGQNSNGNQANFLPLGHVLDHNAGYSVNFHRRVDMEWSNPRPQAMLGHNRGYSDVSAAFKAFNTKLGSNSPTESSSDRKAKPKGYAFNSPWGSRCTFSTSTSGRSLKCMNILGNPVAYGNSTIPPSSIEVSELRFNLPLHGLFKSSGGSSASGVDSDPFVSPKKHHKRSRSSPGDVRFPRPHTSHHTDEIGASLLRPRTRDHPSTERLSSDEDRLDLTLGQEKAGGGIKGNRAKHGKLIIYDQGFKMLDLVVAANMAVFWSVWKGDQYVY
ncbi:hypothetical protein B7463_g5511, partial [Scytalidium lignicola]